MAKIRVKKWDKIKVKRWDKVRVKNGTKLSGIKPHMAHGLSRHGDQVSRQGAG